MDLELHHTPVMTPATIRALNVQSGGRYIDATLGEGGHSKSILASANPGGQILGLDADPEAVAVATERLAAEGDSFLAINVNFRDIRATALRYKFVPVHGVLFDLGVSSLQLDREARGFSFRRSDPLDMRFSLDQKISAADIVNNYAESDLADLIFHLGEDRAARKIARAIVLNRPIGTSLELGEVIEKASPRRGKRINPATRTFQAIRIAVNDELSAMAAYTLADYEYREFVDDGGVDYAGNAIPGLPEERLFAEVAWRDSDVGYATLDMRYAGSFYADNANTAKIDNAWIFNGRVGKKIEAGDDDLTIYFGIDNLFDEVYFDNIRINAFGGRYYEPAPDRTFYTGLAYEL